MQIEAGNYYFCFKTVRMNGHGREAYTKGKVYYSERNGNLTDNDGNDDHGITEDYAATHFVNVNFVMEAYGEYCMNNCRKAV